MSRITCFILYVLPSQLGCKLFNNTETISIFCAVLCLVTQSCPTLCDPMDCHPPGSSVHGDSPGKNIGLGLPWLSPGDLPNPGIEPRSPALQADSLASEPPGKFMVATFGKAQLYTTFQHAINNGRWSTLFFGFNFKVTLERCPLWSSALTLLF